MRRALCFVSFFVYLSRQPEAFIECGESLNKPRYNNYGGIDFNLLNEPKKYDAPRNLRKRFLDLMRVEHEDNIRRITTVNNIRFTWEESPHYEMGYIMGEIIERYRKMVENMHHNKRHALIDENVNQLQRCETVQKMYLEIDHLVRMMHEVPRKYEHIVEFQNIYGDAMDLDEVLYQQRLLEAEKKRLERDQAKYYKTIANMEALYKKHLANLEKAITPPPNQFWSVHYGWEVQYEEIFERMPDPKKWAPRGFKKRS